MIRHLLTAAAVVSLAACNAPEPAEPAPARPPAEQPAQPAPPVPAGDILTAQGYGPLRIGMTKAEVEAALGPDSNPDAVGGPDPASCDMFRPARAPEGVLVMIEEGRLASIWISRNTAIHTDRALSVGDPASEVRRLYGAAAVAEPHKYVEAPAEYLFVWATPASAGRAARGLKYEIGADGKVQSIAGGNASIQYVEGCL